MSVEIIIQTVAEEFKIEPRLVLKRTRLLKIIQARQACQWFMRRYTRMSLTEIGTVFGGYDHATIIHNVRAVDKDIKNDARFKHTIGKIDQRLSNLIQLPEPMEELAFEIVCRDCDAVSVVPGSFRMRDRDGKPRGACPKCKSRAVRKLPKQRAKPFDNTIMNVLAAANGIL